MRLILTLTLFPMALHAQGLSEREALIRNQIEAFRSGDMVQAFGYASEMIQGIFGTPENFGQMVTNSYGMVINPSDIRVVSERPENGAIWLRVLLTGPSGAVSLLDYEIIDTPDGPRINAVQLVPLPDVSA